jgi:hypothetical protein
VVCSGSGGGSWARAPPATTEPTASDTAAARTLRRRRRDAGPDRAGSGAAARCGDPVGGRSTITWGGARRHLRRRRRVAGWYPSAAGHPRFRRAQALQRTHSAARVAAVTSPRPERVVGEPGRGHGVRWWTTTRVPLPPGARG